MTDIHDDDSESYFHAIKFLVVLVLLGGIGYLGYLIYEHHTKVPEGFEVDAEGNIVPVKPKGEEESSGLNAGGIVGIVVAVLFVIFLYFVIFYYGVAKRGKLSEEAYKRINFGNDLDHAGLNELQRLAKYREYVTANRLGTLAESRVGWAAAKLGSGAYNRLPAWRRTGGEV